MKKVAVIMGSDSDFKVVQKAILKLKEFNVPYEVHIMSAHRTPDEAAEFSKNAKNNGFGVIIAAAGMAATRENVQYRAKKAETAQSRHDRRMNAQVPANASIGDKTSDNNIYNNIVII